MEQHIKTYSTEADYESKFGELTAPSVAFVEKMSEENSASTVHFSADYAWAETRLIDQYKTLLEELANRVSELEKGGNTVYLFEAEYNKLTSGLTAVDIYGKIVETKWNDSAVTYCVCEDSQSSGDTPIIIYSAGTLTLSGSSFDVTDGVLTVQGYVSGTTLVLTGNTGTTSGASVSGTTLLVNGTVSGDTLILTAGTVKDGVLTFEGGSGTNPSVDGGTLSLNANVEGTSLVLTNVSVQDKTLNL